MTSRNDVTTETGSEIKPNDVTASKVHLEEPETKESSIDKPEITNFQTQKASSAHHETSSTSTTTTTTTTTTPESKPETTTTTAQTGNEGIVSHLQRLIELNSSMMETLQAQLAAQGRILKSLIEGIKTN